MLGLVRRDPETAMGRHDGGRLTRLDPWEEFNQLRAEMDNLFGGRFGIAPTFAPTGFQPAVDMYETAEVYGINAYLPGMAEDDIHIEATEKTVHIWGENKGKMPEKEVTVHIAQGCFGKFDVQYHLPTEINPDAITANYKDGVLQLTLPKPETAKPKTVSVKVGA